MHDLRWSHAEKQIVRRAFDAALEAAKAGIVAEFKVRAAAAATISDVWRIEDHLRQRRREIDDLFDYRYSRLCAVFARLLCAGYLDEGRLAGLAEEKLAIIRRIRDQMRAP